MAIDIVAGDCESLLVDMQVAEALDDRTLTLVDEHVALDQGIFDKVAEPCPVQSVGNVDCDWGVNQVSEARFAQRPRSVAPPTGGTSPTRAGFAGDQIPGPVRNDKHLHRYRRLRVWLVSKHGWRRPWRRAAYARCG